MRFESPLISEVETDKVREMVGDLGGMHAIIEGLSSPNEEMRDLSSKGN